MAPGLALQTPLGKWQVGNATNATVDDRTAKHVRLQQAAKPTSDLANGSIVIDTPKSGGIGVRNLMAIKLFGTNGDNELLDCDIWKWRLGETEGFWVPTLELRIVDAVLNSAIPGLAGVKPVDTDFYADSMGTVTGSTANRVTEIAGASAAELVMDPFGSELLEFIFYDGSATPAAEGNFLFTGD